jgi:hypothetical protein
MKTHPFTEKYPTRSDKIITECGASRFVTQRLLDLGISHPDLHVYRALWDTGADRTGISKRVVKELGLDIVAYSENHTAGGVVSVTNHLVSLVLPNDIVTPPMLVSCCDIDSADILIGMDVITLGDFAVTNLDGKTTFSFRIPSSETIDFKKQ